MLVKNLNTKITWAVTEEHGARLLRSGDFEEVEYVEDSRVKNAAPHTPFTELPEYEKVTAKQLKAELAHRNVSFDEKTEKQELYAMMKEAFEKVGD
ncbi:hypothetical protein ACIQ1H_09220 [Lysinibacillus sp. NPDC097279]|uniref:hypothetical protein n=1 Tax=Lysinibacillus sp. NPDC097279 TaxID=3364143 RepID=UPI00382A4579